MNIKCEAEKGNRCTQNGGEIQKKMQFAENGRSLSAEVCFRDTKRM